MCLVGEGGRPALQGAAGGGPGTRALGCPLGALVLDDMACWFSIVDTVLRESSMSLICPFLMDSVS